MPPRGDYARPGKLSTIGMVPVPRVPRPMAMEQCRISSEAAFGYDLVHVYLLYSIHIHVQLSPVHCHSQARCIISHGLVRSAVPGCSPWHHVAGSPQCCRPTKTESQARDRSNADWPCKLGLPRFFRTQARKSVQALQRNFLYSFIKATHFALAMSAKVALHSLFSGPLPTFST